MFNISRLVVFTSVALAITLSSVRGGMPSTSTPSASGGGVQVVTYTGGCRAGIVDMNPQFRITKGWAFVNMFAALYDANGRMLMTSGGSGSLVYRSFYGPTNWIKTVRWYVYAPNGGAYVKVFVRNADDHLVLVDTATCRT